MSPRHPTPGPLLALLAGLFLLVAACGGGSDQDTIYWCSMHPDVRQSEPGTCPLCGGMRLVPLDQSLLDAETGVIRLKEAQIQQAGLRFTPVELRDLQRELELTGHFALRPESTTTVHNPIPGSSRVAVVYADTAGQRIKAGEVLLEFENELLEQQVGQLRDAIGRYEDLKQQEGRERQAEEMLKRKELIHQQLEDAGVEREWAMLLAQEERRREHIARFPVRSPQKGVLLRTPIVEAGRYSRQGEALFQVADTSQLWLELETHAQDLAWLERGCRVRYESPAAPGQRFWTALDAVETVMDSGRPEVRVRARATSANGRILPGTWARTTVEIAVPGVLAIPASAVLRSGKRDVAIIADGDGRFRPVNVSLGRRDLSLQSTRSDEQNRSSTTLAESRFHEVLSGIQAGERVVTAGNFLLLSEASFQGALEKLEGAERGQTVTLPADYGAALDALLAQYEILREALAEDRPEGLTAAAKALGQTTQALSSQDLPSSLAGAVKRLGSAAQTLRALPPDSIDLEQARVHFGSISREVVALVRESGRERVESGALHLFRCPMADDYGFDLWLQPSSKMANPYMGQDMLECGVSAEL